MLKRSIYKSIFLSVLFVSTGLLTGATWKRIDYRDGMNKNVCKELKGKVMMYMIFVDSKETTPWSEFDIQSTLDSVFVAKQWLEKQAGKNNIELDIISDYYIGEEYTTIRKNLPAGNIEKSVTEPNFAKGLDEINDWADKIARVAGHSFNVEDKAGIPGIQKPKNKERLVAYLRDLHQVESVALLYMVNNYFKIDISIPVNHMGSKDIEFAVISYKYPAAIAHNFLHLFGAADLFQTPYRRDNKKTDKAREYFRNDIMLDPYGKKLHGLTIDDYTKYLIGWTTELDENYQDLLTDKIVNF